jgi:hypothetical protein
MSKILIKVLDFWPVVQATAKYLPELENYSLRAPSVSVSNL